MWEVPKQSQLFCCRCVSYLTEHAEDRNGWWGISHRHPKRAQSWCIVTAAALWVKAAKATKSTCAIGQKFWMYPFCLCDYSLAPTAPFPRALEEVFFVYAWALRNMSKLGSTGERLLVCGDSAGGNLVLAATLKAIEVGSWPVVAIFVVD